MEFVSRVGIATGSVKHLIFGDHIFIRTRVNTLQQIRPPQVIENDQFLNLLLVF